MTDTATVYIVDDDASVRTGMQRLLRSHGWSVAVFACGEDFLAHAFPAGQGCVLLDLQMPDVTGLEVQQRMAAAGIALPVVFLSGHADIPESVAAMKQGAVDFLVKPVTEEVLLAALQQAIQRHAAECSALRHQYAITECYQQLSQREREVLERVIRGRLNKQIASDLGIAEKTVKVHRARVMEKMAVRSLAELVQMCIAAGIADPVAD